MQHKIPAEQIGPLGPAMADAVSTCVHCGFCLPACPTYQELGQETDSPRGRIVLMKEVLEGSLPVDEAMPHIDSCLGCLACEPACPSGVPYHQLLSPFRSEAETTRRRSLVDRLQRTLTQQTLPYPSRFRLAAKSGRIAKVFSRLLPRSMRVMLDLLPDSLPPAQSWAETNPAVGKRRARVALLTGCAQSVLDPDINTATIEVLTRNGVEVIVPPSQVCCGSLSWHVGNRDQAAGFAKKNIDAFADVMDGPSPVDAIITNAAGCGSGMKEYGLILAGDDLADRGKDVSNKVQDVSQFLESLGDLKPVPAAKQDREMVIAYHDACHLSNALNVRREPRRLLASIPGVTVKEIAQGEMCCGSAGTYNLDQPDVARSLGQQKAKAVIDTGASMVASGNIGCLTQLQTHLKDLGSTITVRHTIQVLRDAYEGSLK